MRWIVLLCVLMRPLVGIAADVAIVTDSAGPVTFEAEGTSRTVEVLASLAAETRLEVAAEASLTLVYLDSGIEYQFVGPTKVVLQSEGPTATSGQPAVQRDLAVSRATDLKTFGKHSYTQTALVLRGSVGSVSLVSPTQTAVSTTRPGFRWEAVEKARDYRFWLRAAGGELVHGGEFSETQIELPRSIELERGAHYVWGVLPRVDGQLTYPSESRFHVLDEASAAEVARYRVAEDASVTERILYAGLLEMHQLFDEAQAYWQSLAKERPDQPRLQEKAQSR